MAKIVNIEWMQPTRKFQCPCCSASALNADGKIANRTCPHFLFSWDGDRQDFVDFADEVESILDDSSLAIDEPLDQKLVESLPASSLVYAITVRNEALGPIERTDVLAFNPQAA